MGSLGGARHACKLVKKSKATWDALVETVCDLLGSDYIRSKGGEPEAIVDARATIPPERLQKCGLSIVQEETFFVDPEPGEIETGGPRGRLANHIVVGSPRRGTRSARGACVREQGPGSGRVGGSARDRVREAIITRKVTGRIRLPPATDLRARLVIRP